jgi:hypothetical protein
MVPVYATSVEGYNHAKALNPQGVDAVVGIENTKFPHPTERDNMTSCLFDLLAFNKDSLAIEEDAHGHGIMTCVKHFPAIKTDFKTMANRIFKAHESLGLGGIGMSSCDNFSTACHWLCKALIYTYAGDNANLLGSNHRNLRQFMTSLVEQAPGPANGSMVENPVAGWRQIARDKLNAMKNAATERRQLAAAAIAAASP